MFRWPVAMLWVLAVLACPGTPARLLPSVLPAVPARCSGLAWAVPPGPADLARSIDTAKRGIAEFEKTILAYDAEMRATVANDPAAAKRREEIRILKQHYVREIEALRAKIIDDYKKIQEFRASGVQ